MIICVLLLIALVFAQSIDTFIVHDNGRTIVCDDAINGDVGLVEGVEYTKRSREQLIELIRQRDVDALRHSCTSGITDMSALFSGQVELNPGISTWDTSDVKTMDRMFQGATAFNADISFWSTHRVRQFENMFQGADAFTGDLTGWCVRLFEDAPKNFMSATTGEPLSAQPPKWGECPVRLPSGYVVTKDYYSIPNGLRGAVSIKSKIAPRPPNAFLQQPGTETVDCKVRFNIASSGKVDEVSIVDCPELFHKTTLKTLKKWRFNPVLTTEDVAIPVSVEYNVRYKRK